MDTKSKSSRYLRVVLVAFILTVTIMGLAAVDVYENRHYLDKDFYLNQNQYGIADELATFVRILKDVHVDSADYSGKTDEQKAAPDQVKKLNAERDQKLEQANAEIAAEFDPRIEAARTAGNQNLESQLAAEKAEKLTERQKQIQDDWQEKLAALAAEADMRYEVKQYSLLLREGTFKYYIKDKSNNKVYTNLEKEPTEAEVRQSALITVQIPSAGNKDSWGMSHFFQKYQWEGLIYIPREADPYSSDLLHRRADIEERFAAVANTTAPATDPVTGDAVVSPYPEDEENVSQARDVYALLDAAETGYFRSIISDANYFQSLRERLLKEILILVIGLIAAAVLAWHLKQQKAVEQPIVASSLALLRRVPLDIRVLLLLPASIFYLIIMDVNAFFSFPIGIEHVVQLILLFPFTCLFLLYLVEAWQFYKNPASLREQWEKGFTQKLFVLIKESFLHKGVLFKLVILFGLSVGMVLCVPAGLLAIVEGGTEGVILLLMVLVYSAFYLLFVFPYILRRIGLLNRILLGVAEMSAGNFETVIESGKTRGKLADTAQALNRLKDSVKRSLQDQIKSERLKSELITNVSHDLKTPLTSIINYVDLLKREEATAEERQKYVSILERKTERLKVLIDDLFEASKMASGSVELNIEQVNVASLLNQAIAEFSDKIEQSSLTFRVNVESNKIHALLDGKKTWRVFENLISNALKYAMPGTRVLIDLAEDDHAVHFSIKNVASYEIDFDADELFERFKRADTSRNTEGSGLGLAIAKSIVELQGGSMSLDIDGDYFKVRVKFPK